MEFYDSKVFAEGVQKNILSFSDLPVEIKEQVVDTETSLDQLSLPETLTAVCDSVQETEQEETVLHTEEIVQIENITWISTPEYNSDVEGLYVFTPDLLGEYTLSEGVELPKINVFVKEPDISQEEEIISEISEIEEENKKRDSFTEDISGEESKERIQEEKELKIIESEEDVLLTADTSTRSSDPVQPSCGNIEEDTVWEKGSITTEGEINVKAGVTLTLKGQVNIENKVVVTGGGTIERGNGVSGFTVRNSGELTLRDIVIDGKNRKDWGGATSIAPSENSTICINGSGSRMTLESGCVIRNCYKDASGTVITIEQKGELIINDVLFENNGKDWGAMDLITDFGVINIFGQSILKIYGGIYQNNAGGLIKNSYGGKLYIYGGKFIGNTGYSFGCISNTNSDTFLYGGYFKDNKGRRTDGDDLHPNKGAGGIMVFSSEGIGTLTISKEVQLCGDGDSDSGVDSIYMEFPKKWRHIEEYDKNPPNPIQITGTMNDPVNLRIDLKDPNPNKYLVVQEAEGFVIVKGTEGYQLSESDIDKVHLILPFWPSGVPYYKVLDKEKNNIYITLKNPSEEKNTFDADFYSGENCEKETITSEIAKDDTARVTTPKLKEMPGWNILGWSRDLSKYDCDTEEEKDVVLTEDASFYGIYQKDVNLSYDLNIEGQTGSEMSVPKAEKKACYANVHEKITYQKPEFKIASGPVRGGYLFQGWNTRTDGNGISYPAYSVQKFDQDTVLYAKWERDPNAVSYKIEHYQQDLEGEGYTKIDSDTETLFGTKGSTVAAKAKKYEGFKENTSHPSRNAVGTLTENENLVLKLYYDRNIYEVSFDLKGGNGTVPETQKIPYGGLLQKPKDPGRRGYNFKGWYLNENEENERLWDFDQPVEKNTANLWTVLPAKWKDELAPEMEKASFSSGYKDFLNWIIQKPGIVVTVPVTEEGSGLKSAEYTLIWEDGTKEKGTVQITELYEDSEQIMAYGSAASVLRGLQKEAGTGKYEVKFQIEKEFKGKIVLSCRDNAGNLSGQKILTAAGRGIILEDNAPVIHFSDTKNRKDGETAEISVLVEDGKEGRITGGIQGITYQIDKEKEVTLPKEDFEKELVESYDFKVEISGKGTHTLKVTARDNAENESKAQITIKIQKETVIEPQNPKDPGPSADTKLPRGPEPKTGDYTHIKMYATFSMIAGFGYLLLYFAGEHGITEQEKEDILQRLVGFGKQGGRFQRIFALAAIFLFLAYYHSIGKSVTVEWREVCLEKTKRNSHL
ncbi:MAG: InlB B-repeat-containing protein [Lachnospiraceae bacterium]|nr:InlB B-repeat-containing protein [Lachnospiraceae bacterium]